MALHQHDYLCNEDETITVTDILHAIDEEFVNQSERLILRYYLNHRNVEQIAACTGVSCKDVRQVFSDGEHCLQQRLGCTLGWARARCADFRYAGL
jgi:hypothetical protein